MTSLLLAVLWGAAVLAVAVMPRRHHRPGAMGLVAAGVPILGWLTWVHGPAAGLVALGAGAAVLRWPPRHLGRWLRRRR